MATTMDYHNGNNHHHSNNDYGHHPNLRPPPFNDGGGGGSSGKKKSSTKKDMTRWTVTKEELAGSREECDNEFGTADISWAEMNTSERAKHVGVVLLKLALLLLVIFTFICTLGLLADAFKLIGGKGIGEAVRNSKIIQNPVSASIVGMVITLILQSSSTLISILVGMVAGRIITVHEAIPLMMGAEIGSSFFNALISLGQSGNRDQFRRAFAAATMNDIFNFLAYLVILPLEILTGIIENISEFFVGPLSGARSSSKFQTLNVLTDPILNKIIQLDEDAINNSPSMNQSTETSTTAVPSKDDDAFTLVLKCIHQNGTEIRNCEYDHLFAYSTWSDQVIGFCLLAISILLLVLCLVGIVRLLNTLLAGQVAIWVRQIVDKQLPRPFGWLTNYLVMLFGCFVVMIVQSSGVFRSALIPLCGIGVVTLERFYPLLLGANVGTTFTGILAALSADPRRIKETMQMALCQTVYNLLSILFFYPIPFTRRIPMTLAMRFGDITAKYRWFALVYILVVFFLMPASLLLLSFLPPELMISLLALLAAVLLFILLVNILQRRCPTALPVGLRDWHFLPKHFRSLQPYDHFMSKILQLVPFFRTSKTPNKPPKNSQNRGDEVATNEEDNKDWRRRNVRINNLTKSLSQKDRQKVFPTVREHIIVPNQVSTTHFPPNPPTPKHRPSISVQTDV